MYVPFYFKNNYYSRHYPVSYLLVLPPQWILKLNKTLIPLPFDLSIPRSSHFHSDISHFIIKAKNVAVRSFCERRNSGNISGWKHFIKTIEFWWRGLPPETLFIYLPTGAVLTCQIQHFLFFISDFKHLQFFEIVLIMTLCMYYI